MDLQQADVALYAISYDDVETLAAFADKHAITYPLLSDTGSPTIRDLGLLNEHLEQQHAAYGIATRDEQRGVAYSGTFVLDAQGFVREKHFEQSYRVRPTRSIILEWANPCGHRAGEPTAPPPDTSIVVRAWTDQATYRPYQQLRLNLRLVMRPGLHVYAAPVPPGYHALAIEVDPVEGLQVGDILLPQGRPFSISRLDEAFVVYEGTIEATLPFVLTRNLGPTILPVRVSYQACTALECFPPSSVDQQVVLTGLDLIRG